MVELIDDLLRLHLYVQHLHDNVERVSREVDDMIEDSRPGLLRLSCLDEIRAHLDIMDNHARKMAGHLDRERKRLKGL